MPQNQVVADVKSPLEMFYRWERETPDKVYLRQPRVGAANQWDEYTWAQVGDQMRRVARYLRERKLPAGSRIAIWSSNSKDWIIADLAIMLAGHVSVPLYPGQDVASARYILEHSESRLIFVGAFDQSARADEAIPADVPRIALHGATVPCGDSLQAIVSRHAPLAESPRPDLDAIFTLIYTSGTTGNPKGVMHAHGTPGHVCPDLAGLLRHVTGEARFFSYLPLSHAAERILVEMGSLYSNGCVSFNSNVANFGDELRSVRPTFFFSVPRLWVKFKDGIDAKVPPSAQANLSSAQKAGIVANLGLDRATMIITGSAPCPRSVQQWFIDLGVLLRDGYGMTENFIHGCAWVHDDQPVSGCVGRGFGPLVELRVSDEGEILFRSPGLMKGYYREPEKTAEALRDGWYHTGDSGRIDEQGNLWVTGRVSEVFKTSKGKFVRPVNLEDRFGRSPLIAQTCVFGHGLDQPAVAVTLTASGRALDAAALRLQLGALLDEINAESPAWERIATMLVAREEWSIDNALLTPTMKLKRKAVEQRFREQIEAAIGKTAVVLEANQPSASRNSA